MNTATMMLIGSGIQAGAKVSGGISALGASKFTAAALERQATEERAAGQRSAGERRLEMERVLSRARAIGAASGAPGGPSLRDVVGDIRPLRITALDDQKQDVRLIGHQQQIGHRLPIA